MRKAFTLIELVVALGILALVLSFASVIFRVSIGAHRMAMANAEIMQKLRVITEQLDADFKGLLIEYGGAHTAHTETITIDGQDHQVHSDTMVFFTAGDFQSTDQYDSETIAGNVACVFYGQPDPNSYLRPPQPEETVLLRRQTILAPEVPGGTPGSDPRGEFYRTSAAQWNVTHSLADELQQWTARPVIDANDVKQYQPLFMARGVHDFTIEYLEYTPGPTTGELPWQRDLGDESNSAFMPRAFKFSFTLYDSHRIIPKGRTFTHIVLLDF